MILKSKFRKLLWIRIGIGAFLFISILSFCFLGILNQDKTTKQGLTLAFIMLIFLAFLSTSIFRIFSLKITENGIEKTQLLFRTKENISFSSILSINIQKTRFRNTRGVDISNGFHYSILKLEGGNDLIISPDNFENYDDIISTIKSQLGNSHIA